MNQNTWIPTVFLLAVAGWSMLNARPGSDLRATYLVKGRVTQTFSYCGGAAPTREMEEERMKPAPWSEKAFYIRSGDANKAGARLWKVTTDSNGYFAVRLPAGRYCVVNTWQVKTPDYGHITGNSSYQYQGDDCLRAAWANCFERFTVKKGKKIQLNLNYHHQCFAQEDNPCMQYIGPYPP